MFNMPYTSLHIFQERTLGHVKTGHCYPSHFLNWEALYTERGSSLPLKRQLLRGKTKKKSQSPDS